MLRDRFQWAHLLSFATGLVNQELLLRNEYLAAENRILGVHLPARLRLSDAERAILAEIAKRLGRKAVKKMARGQPDTLRALLRSIPRPGPLRYSNLAHLVIDILPQLADCR